MEKRAGRSFTGVPPEAGKAGLVKGPAAALPRAAGALALLAFLLLPADNAFPIGQMSGGGFVVSRRVSASGGRRTVLGALALNTTVGEAGTGAAAGGAYRLHPGYMKLAAQPGSVTSITAVTKSTGALELAWAAPGLDGFSGDVAAGFYRVDYSSDPAHAFRPTVFQLEFSTSVTAGEPQALNIPGLLANTTYYTKVYLSGAQKYFSEYSSRSDQSTLADLPVNPVLAYISACKATITWQLPPGGAEGYRTEASSTSFGDLAPEGTPKVKQTGDGLQASMTLAGLAPASTYYFKIASRNWQGDRNFTSILSAVTLPGACGTPVMNLYASPNHGNRTVTLSWADPADPDIKGVLVVLSTNPVAEDFPDGNNFSPGQALGDGLVRGIVSTNTFSDSGLKLDVPYYYHLYTQDNDLAYSVSVSTSIFLDLPPMAPAGLTAMVTPAGNQVVLAWRKVISNRDGSYFVSGAAPMAVELDRYKIERATSIVNANWVSVATVPIAAETYVETLPNPGQQYYYRVTSLDSLGTSDTAMVVDTGKNIYVTAPDQVTRLTVPAAISEALLASHNALGRDILIRAVEEQAAPEDEKVFTAVRFEAYTAEDNKVLDKFKLPGPQTNVTLAYKVAGDHVVPAGLLTAPASIAAIDAEKNLGMYWNNGQKYVKLYGDIDTSNRTVSVKTLMTGSYQIRSLYRESGVTFDISNLSNKMITPNGDGRNDAAVFLFDNPKDSGYSGKIFDAEGAFVADMVPGPIDDTLKWDGKANGRVVPGGVYAYQIRAEGKLFTGTLVVVR
ncbi:MAG TPA: gliding motility-associated C-terminal domain-containing protein [Elusimicrobiales bacterium]|nr:gliding motility-associated C-terminal domain-containing protein [Elusimicrobiales bacterium]